MQCDCRVPVSAGTLAVLGSLETRLIIFDTNAVDLLRPDSLRADLIRKLRESGHHRVAVPWMVLEELVAHQAKPYILKHQSVTRGLDALRGVAPWEVDISLERLDLERIQGHWRSQYLKIFEVIETTGDAAKQALIREALALPPRSRVRSAPKAAAMRPSGFPSSTSLWRTQMNKFASSRTTTRTSVTAPSIHSRWTRTSAAWRAASPG